MARMALWGFLIGILAAGPSGCSKKEEEPVQKKDSPFRNRKFQPKKDEQPTRDKEQSSQAAPGLFLT
jgi:hypothetical protein